MRNVLSLTLLAAAALGSAQTILGAGDLAIVGYNSSNPDQLASVALKPLDAGTTFYFADYGWSSTNNTFRFGGEGYVKVTLNRAFALGEVLLFDSGATFNFPATTDFTYAYENAGVEYPGGTITPTAQYLPSGAGDGTFLFQASAIADTATPSVTELSLIYGVNADGTSVLANGWQADATNSNTSALPGALTAGTTAIGLVQGTFTTEFDNYVYTGTRSGTPAQLLAAIGDRANWTGQDTTNYAFNATPFAVVPEPASMAVLGLGLAALKRRRKG